MALAARVGAGSRSARVIVLSGSSPSGSRAGRHGGDVLVQAQHEPRAESASQRVPHVPGCLRPDAARCRGKAFGERDRFQLAGFDDGRDRRAEPVLPGVGGGAGVGVRAAPVVHGEPEDRRAWGVAGDPGVLDRCPAARDAGQVGAEAQDEVAGAGAGDQPGGDPRDGTGGAGGLVMRSPGSQASRLPSVSSRSVSGSRPSMLSPRPGEVAS